MKGVMGRILWVNLSDSTMRLEVPSEEFYQTYLGGYGLAARLLYDRIPPGIDPLGPENILGFTTGPLTGTMAITGNRFTVVGKSPKTGGWGDANCGGTFGPALKFAGFDAVFFTGIAPSPVYLYLNDGKAELRDARSFWGNGIDVERALKAELGRKVEVAWIGEAGEKGDLMAGVMNDEGRAAARSGLGAVMGAKRLKAVAAYGLQKVPVADEDGLRRYTTGIMRATKEANTPIWQMFTTFGTGGLTAQSALNGDTPIRNWAGAGVTDFPTAPKISDVALKPYELRRTGCWHCQISCSAYQRVSDGPYATEGEHTHRPEYEALGAFGGMTLTDDIEALHKCNELCNRYGLDVISTGSVIAFAMECYEKGVIDRQETGGLKLIWGNAEAVVALTEQIGRREGFGAILADGVAKAAARIGRGSEAFAVHIHGEEPAMHDPRLSPGLALTYQVDATPARHTQGGTGEMEFMGVEVIPEPFNVNKRDYAHKGPAHRYFVNVNHVRNGAGICLFSEFATPPEALGIELSLVTGELWDEARIQVTGERIATLRHAFNLREGLNPVHFKMPDRLLDGRSLPGGPNQGVVIDLEAERRSYFDAVGWDQESAVPSIESLRRVGLEDLIADLHH